MKGNTSKRRSADAQLKAMAKQWPDFNGKRHADGTLRWVGPLRPMAQHYIISVVWKPGTMSRPHVRIDDPPLEPRPGGTFAEIPHLMFCDKEPDRSALCLFDPDAREWTPADLIAETTILWAAEWLIYYELWHMTGEWSGPSVGYESVAHMRAAAAQTVEGVIR